MLLHQAGIGTLEKQIIGEVKHQLMALKRLERRKSNQVLRSRITHNLRQQSHQVFVEISSCATKSGIFQDILLHPLDKGSKIRIHSTRGCHFSSSYPT